MSKKKLPSKKKAPKLLSRRDGGMALTGVSSFSALVWRSRRVGVPTSTPVRRLREVPRWTWDNPPRLRRSLRHDLRPNLRGCRRRDDAGQPTDCADRRLRRTCSIPQRDPRIL